MRSERRRIAAILVLAAWLSAASTPTLAAPPGAAERERRVAVEAQAVSAATPILIDGRFDEPVWGQAPVIGEFVQREPAEGAAPTERTEARFAFDDDAIYIAVRAFDREPGRITGMLTRRDERSPSDWLKVAIDSYYDHRTAYEFGVNPAGVKTDRYYFNDGASDDSWDAVWDVQVTRDPDGWRAEFRIPFSQLRFARGGGPVGVAVIRDLPRANETATWPLIARSVNGFVSQFGTVSGLEAAIAPKRLELMPYTVGEVVRASQEAGNPLSRATDPGANLGVDLKYAVTPALTLTATLNPDFGQVEADPAAVNLDAFELFFAERRPFFVEGSGVFRFNMDCNDGDCTGLLYSRRIGRAPQGSADEADGEYSQAPTAATILGAAKLTGRVGQFSVGALSAVTQEEQATIASGLTRRNQTVEPLTSFNVLRTRREFANNSNLGVMLTTTRRQHTADTAFLADNSVVGGVDYDWRLGRRFAVTGYFAGSRVAGSAEAIERLQTNAVHNFQRPDGDYLTLDTTATTLTGHAGAVGMSKIGGERVRFSANYGYKSPGFESNDLGFLRRADERTMNHWFQWRDQTPGKYVRQYMVNVNQWAGWNFGGDRLFGGGNVNMHWTFQNNWRTGFGLNGNGAGVRDRSTRGGPVVTTNRNVSLWHYVEGDNRRLFAPGYNGYFERDGQGTFRMNANPVVTWRPSRAVRLEGGLRFNRNDDDAQWVENVDDDTGATHYVFGRLEQRTVAMTLRANYTVSPTLSFQAYAEPFVSAGSYRRFRELTNGRAARYADRFQPYAYAGDADFNYRSFRTTNVLRWEYKPGSALFVVWQQGRQDDGDRGDLRFGRDFGGLFAAPSRNVFLVKFSYWLNY
ncbi:MAG: carbohydrate binding family 9 domain-containing protein [Acidobacteria bacterium]|nr:carbohydrate binding family 9 domain-containing protein [Acidobacteriota bacterium]